ncbi:MAG: hypothetical protein JWN45_404 [Acidobacteriaceae bacterium]|nr:hypothetical protein [Acidobacteriaceae bacterium]
MVFEVVLAILLPAACVVVLAGVCGNAITLANATVSARPMNFFMLLFYVNVFPGSVCITSTPISLTSLVN